MNEAMSLKEEENCEIDEIEAIATLWPVILLKNIGNREVIEERGFIGNVPGSFSNARLLNSKRLV